MTLKAQKINQTEKQYSKEYVVTSINSLDVSHDTTKQNLINNQNSSLSQTNQPSQSLRERYG